MTALVTPQRMRAVYTMLRAFPPFQRWVLPDPSAVKFEVLSGSDIAEYSIDYRDRPCIALNADMHLSLPQMVESIAHEMVHMRQDQLERLPDDHSVQHNAEFRRLARTVCRTLGFDVQRF